MSTFSPAYSEVHSAVALSSTFSPGVGKIFTGTTISSTFSAGYSLVFDDIGLSSTMSPAYSDTTTVNLPDFVRPLKRRANRSYSQQVEETDALIISSVIRETAGQADVYGKIDTFTTEVDLGTAPTVADINIGGASAPTLISGDICVIPNFAVADDLLILKKDQLAAAEAAYAVEREDAGDDSLLLWNETDSRFDLGFADTENGTTIPTALQTFADFKVNNLLLDSTAITADGSITITATGTNDLTLTARSSSITLNDASNTTIDSSITETSLIGILNSLRTGGIVQLQNISDDYTNGEGVAITEGQVTRISADDTVMLSVATTDTAAADYIGVVADSSIASAASGTINTLGVANVRFETGLSLGAGNEVFISATTSGSATNVRPTTSGNIAQSIGFIRDATAYNGVTNLLAEVDLVRGAKAVIS